MNPQIEKILSWLPNAKLGKKEVSLSFNILVKEEDGLFLAHCLELDILTASKTLEQVNKDIVALICAQVDYAFSNDNLENLYHPAPKEAWEELYACKNAEERRHRIKPTFGRTSESLIPPSWLIAKTCRVPRSCRT